MRVGVAVLAVILVGALAYSLTHGSATSTSPGGGSGNPTPPSGPPESPSRPVFFFRIDTKSPAYTGKRAKTAADDASIEIGGQLSTFYDTAFVDPTTWTGGVPDRAWGIFDPSVLDLARKDAAALTMGDQAAGLLTITVKQSSLTVRVLLDPRGHPAAAVAEVEFVAVGKTKDGDALNVTNQASFLLRPENGLWMVVGYPSASTDVKPKTAKVTPTPSGSATP
jgi:hypothetical protein